MGASSAERVGATVAQAAALHTGYLDQALGDHAPVCEALAAFNHWIPTPLTAEQALTKKQRGLTQLVDKASWDKNPTNASVCFQATLRSEAEPGARAFLAAVPSGRTQMEPTAFCAELRHCLGVADSTSDEWCPKCDGVLDTFSYHATTCCAGGERTLRHHAIRDLLYTWTARAGLQPEREKTGLLLPQRPEDHNLAGRRPADLFVPSYLGSPLHMTWLSQPLNGKRPSVRRRDKPSLPPQRMLTPRQHIYELSRCAEHRELSFFLSLLKPRQPGTRSLLPSSNVLPELLPLAKGPMRRRWKGNCSRSSAPRQEASGLVRSSTDELNWPCRRGRMPAFCYGK